MSIAFHSVSTTRRSNGMQRTRRNDVDRTVA